MGKILIRIGIVIGWVVLSVLIGWNYWGERVLTPSYIPINLAIILLIMFLIEIFFFKRNMIKLLKDYLIVILIIAGIYGVIYLNQLVGGAMK